MFKRFYEKYVGNKVNLILGLIIFSFLLLTVVWKSMVQVNDLMHFRVIEHRVTGGDLTVEKKPGHIFVGVNKAYPWEWSNAIWFSAFKNEGGDVDNSVPLRYIDGATASQSGIMVYEYEESIPDSLLTAFQDEYFSQENFENRIIRPLNLDALKVSASIMTSVESYTVRKKEYGFRALDQLQFGIYRTEVKRDSVVDFTGERVVTDVPKVIYEPDPDSLTTGNKERAVRTNERSLNDMFINVLLFSLYEPDYAADVDSIITKKRTRSMDRTISLAKTKLETRTNYFANVKGQVDVLEQKYQTMAEQQVGIVQSELQQDTTRIKAETGRAVANIRRSISKMKKEIGERNGEKEQTIRKLMVGADNQLDARVTAYEKAQIDQADAFANAKGIMPRLLLSGRNSKMETGVDVFLLNQLHELGAKKSK